MIHRIALLLAVAGLLAALAGWVGPTWPRPSRSARTLS
jgi:hypothetical protein